MHERAREFGIELSPKVLDQFDAYFQLLAKWNERMNLTALPLKALDAPAFDRLFLNRSWRHPRSMSDPATG